MTCKFLWAGIAVAWCIVLLVVTLLSERFAVPQELQPGGTADEARVLLSATCVPGPALPGGLLTVVEEAVLKVLPRWPEAYEAVMEYARYRAGGGNSDAFVPRKD
ncbi:MAG: hypothetical protein SGI92_02920 [Bryobacteraceae bacterium]|nr:hypothetical protein [Bryobacteraceae bacterium]